MTTKEFKNIINGMDGIETVTTERTVTVSGQKETRSFEKFVITGELAELAKKAMRETVETVNHRSETLVAFLEKFGVKTTVDDAHDALLLVSKASTDDEFYSVFRLTGDGVKAMERVVERLVMTLVVDGRVHFVHKVPETKKAMQARLEAECANQRARADAFAKELEELKARMAEREAKAKAKK